jgi:quinol monooxygenase YgiN
MLTVSMRRAISVSAKNPRKRTQDSGVFLMNPGCTLIAYLHAKPEKRDELIKVMEGFVVPTRAEPDCVEYHLHASDDDPNLFVFYENWRSRKALDAHLRMPYLTSFWDRRMDLLTKDVDIKFYTMMSDFNSKK